MGAKMGLAPEKHLFEQSSSGGTDMGNGGKIVAWKKGIFHPWQRKMSPSKIFFGVFINFENGNNPSDNDSLGCKHFEIHKSIWITLTIAIFICVN